jgi:hypothetical protein
MKKFRIWAKYSVGQVGGLSKLSIKDLKQILIQNFVYLL